MFGLHELAGKVGLAKFISPIIVLKDSGSLQVTKLGLDANPDVSGSKLQTFPLQHITTPASCPKLSHHSIQGWNRARMYPIDAPIQHTWALMTKEKSKSSKSQPERMYSAGL